MTVKLLEECHRLVNKYLDVTLIRPVNWTILTSRPLPRARVPVAEWLELLAFSYINNHLHLTAVGLNPVMNSDLFPISA